jgi:tol-pal system protein YbgF
MRMHKQLTFTLLLTASLIVFSSGAALAQQAASEADVFAPVTNLDATPTAKPVKKPKTTTVAAARPVAAPAAQGTQASDVDQRLQQLEEQIADMQVVVGTMESTGKGRPGGGAPAAMAANNDVDVRVGKLEAQIQSLGTQMAGIANELHGLEAKLQTGTVTPLKAPAPPARQPVAAAQPPVAAADADTTFGTATVTQGAGANEAANEASAGQVLPLPPLAGDQAPQTAALTQPTNDPQAAYDQAFGLIQQQDYAGAETAFRDYLTRFAQSPLASNAQYWLGQTFYVRGQYKPAADAFLKGYKSYRTGQKAPDSLLKVAMSLSRLGQKDLACSAFTALDGEFPNASAQIKHLEQSERERAGC